jgi:uncharacterized protein YigE (DUF2233 family)
LRAAFFYLAKICYTERDMKYFRYICVAVLLTTLGTGCVQVETSRTPEQPTQTQNRLDVGEDIERRVITFGSERYDKLVLYRFAGDAFKWRFAYSNTPKPVSQWRTDTSATMVVNGTYFHEDQFPSGFLVVDGKAVGERSFDYDKSGVVNLRPDVEIIDTTARDVSIEDLTFAGQSYPFLVKNNEPAIAEDSGLTGRRSFFGTTQNGDVVIGVVPSTRISLHKLSRILVEETGIAWKHVMNLDGGTSTGLSINSDGWNETIDSLVPVPSVIIAEPADGG